jgi:hypothetical protein
MNYYGITRRRPAPPKLAVEESDELVRLVIAGFGLGKAGAERDRTAQPG